MTALHSEVTGIGMQRYQKEREMAKSVRLVVEMTPQVKRALAKRARQAGLSPWDLVRRQLNILDEIDGCCAEIEALLVTLEKAY